MAPQGGLTLQLLKPEETLRDECDVWMKNHVSFSIVLNIVFFFSNFLYRIICKQPKKDLEFNWGRFSEPLQNVKRWQEKSPPPLLKPKWKCGENFSQ
jgi:hypothetical protein